MLIVNLKDCPEFVAGDGSLIREMLHPDRQQIDVRYSLAHARVPPGQATAPHRLTTSELYYILQGEGLMHIDAESAPVHPGQAIYIPPYAVQNIENTGPSDLVVLCIVDPAWRKEDEEVL